MRALKVAFEPGARTAWHTHPLGQTLYIISGTGLIGLRNEAPQLIKAGDTVWIPPGEEHWHGASAENSMTHIAIQEALNGSVATWLEKVSVDGGIVLGNKDRQMNELREIRKKRGNVLSLRNASICFC